MITTYKKDFTIRSEDFQRDQRINSKLNLKKLPFKITIDNFCTRYTEMFLDFKPLFTYQSGEYAMKWCCSTEKRLKLICLTKQNTIFIYLKEMETPTYNASSAFFHKLYLVVFVLKQ